MTGFQGTLIHETSFICPYIGFKAKLIKSEVALSKGITILYTFYMFLKKLIKQDSRDNEFTKQI